MAKELKAKIKLQCPGGQATPAPPVGPALGQHGVNIGEFVKRFNDATSQTPGMIIPVEISVYADRTFDFILKCFFFLYFLGTGNILVWLINLFDIFFNIFLYEFKLSYRTHSLFLAYRLVLALNLAGISSRSEVCAVSKACGRCFGS